VKAERDNLDYLQDILAMMDKVERFTAGIPSPDYRFQNEIYYYKIEYY